MKRLFNHPKSPPAANPWCRQAVFAPAALVLAVLVAAVLLSACGTRDHAEDDVDNRTEDVTMGPTADFYLGGIQVNEDNNEAWLDALEARGMNTISVTDYARQADWDTEHLTWQEDNPSVLAEIKAAKARQMHVVMILRVHLEDENERNRFLWHGMIMPTTDAQVASWFEQYTQFALRWAKIAQREGVDVLMIGSEMNALASTHPVDEVPEMENYFLDKTKQAERKKEFLNHQAVSEQQDLHLLEGGGYDNPESYIEDRIRAEEQWAAKVATAEAQPSVEDINRRRQLLEGHWQELIRRLREVYKGRLGYAANFDQFELVGFWPQLDVMGINAYFPLRHRLQPTERYDDLYSTLEVGWTNALDSIGTLRRERGLETMPVIFSEMGYTYRANSTLNPWADTGFAFFRDVESDGSEGQERLVVWRDQPEDLQERALAVRALHRAHQQRADPFLEGILYWKLSTIPSHHDIESFVLLIDQSSEDPLIQELQRFNKP